MWLLQRAIALEQSWNVCDAVHIILFYAKWLYAKETRVDSNWLPTYFPVASRFSYLKNDLPHNHGDLDGRQRERLQHNLMEKGDFPLEESFQCARRSPYVAVYPPSQMPPNYDRGQKKNYRHGRHHCHCNFRTRFGAIMAAAVERFHESIRTGGTICIVSRGIGRTTMRKRLHA